MAGTNATAVPMIAGARRVRPRRNKWLEELSKTQSKKLPKKKIAQQSDEIKQPFRFMDLPPEMRNRVYAHYVAISGGDGTHAACTYNLADFKTPTIAQVSRQLRTEALPAFFAEASFYVTMPCNLLDFSRSNHGINPRNVNWTESMGFMRDRRVSGRLGMKRAVKDCVRTYGKDAVFRDITFKMADAEYIDEKNRTHIIEENVLYFIRFSYHGKVVHVEAEAGHDCPKLPDQDDIRAFSFDRSDVEKVVESVSKLAKKMGKREDFIGFTHKDLEELARVFRWSPPLKEEQPGARVRIRL